MAGKLSVTLKRSMIGTPEKHRRVLRGLGLTRMNKTVQLDNVPSIKGMMRKVLHLIEAEEIKQ